MILRKLGSLRKFYEGNTAKHGSGSSGAALKKTSGKDRGVSHSGRTRSSSEPKIEMMLAQSIRKILNIRSGKVVVTRSQDQGKRPITI